VRYDIKLPVIVEIADPQASKGRRSHASLKLHGFLERSVTLAQRNRNDLTKGRRHFRSRRA
jgi:hypothetical protein